MDIRIRGTREEVDALLPGLLRGGLKVRSLYDSKGEVAVYLEPSGTPLPSAQFPQARQQASPPQARQQASPPQARQQASPPQARQQASLPQQPAALPSGERSLRDHFSSLGIDMPAFGRR